MYSDHNLTEHRKCGGTPKQYKMLDPKLQTHTCVNPPTIYRNDLTFVSEKILLQNQKPTAPTLSYTIGDQTYGLPVKHVHLRTKCYADYMYGSLRVVFTNNTPNEISGTFAFSSEARVAAVYVGTTYVYGDRTPESHILYDPIDVVRCPINWIKPGEDVIINIQFRQNEEDMLYVENCYQFSVPLSFDPNILPVGVNYQEVVYIEASINCPTYNIQYGSKSHRMLLVSHTNYITSLVADLSQGQASVDFHFAYAVEKQTAKNSIEWYHDESIRLFDGCLSKYRTSSESTSSAPDLTALKALIEASETDHENWIDDYLRVSFRLRPTIFRDFLDKNPEFDKKKSWQWTDTKAARCSEGKNHDTSKLHSAFHDFLGMHPEFGTKKSWQWTEMKAARCSEGKNHDPSEFQSVCNDVMSIEPKPEVYKRQGADLKTARKYHDPSKAHTPKNDITNIHSAFSTNTTNCDEELRDKVNGALISATKIICKVSQIASGRTRIVLEKILCFSSDHYFASMFTVLSLILTIETLTQRNSATLNFDTFYRNCAILSLLTAFANRLVFIKSLQKLEAKIYELSHIENRVMELDEEMGRLQKSPRVQAENVFTEGSEQNIVNILVNQGDVGSVEQILENSSLHNSLAFSSSSNGNIKPSNFASEVMACVAESAHTKADSAKEFGLDEEMYTSLDVIQTPLYQ